MYLLGGRLFGNETHIEIGKKLTNGCVWVYESLPNGIMPEVLQMTACPSFSACPYDPTQPSPFTRVIDPKYALRPEAVESVFYAYRITGDPRYQDIAWQMFQDIETHTQTLYGNAAIRNVTAEDVELDDSMESFWMSETLKYFYLLFSEPELVSLDEWVFNTEAHPFRLSNG
jgi:mannosyl-oligosaccharide alpha-1,2-mannosidase